MCVFIQNLQRPSRLLACQPAHYPYSVQSMTASTTLRVATDPLAPSNAAVLDVVVCDVGRYQQTISFSIVRRNATHCISPYAIVMCVCVCVCLSVGVCVCVCRVCGPQENCLRYRRHLFSILLEMTPDIAYKSLTQIGLQIPRWRTKWRP